MSIGSLIRKMQSLLIWLLEPQIIYLALLPVVTGICAISFAHASEPSVRLTGLALEILGIATVIWGISKTRDHFGHPALFDVVRNWLRRFPLKRGHVTIQADGISMSMSATGGRLISIFTPSPNAPTNERLINIEKGLETLQNRIDGAENQLDTQKGELEGKVKAESRAREAEDQRILKNFETSSTGGLHISAIGALWLFFGVVLSTASPEIAGLLR